MEYMEFRLRCPYGKWTCGDGREVIFNREYWPILERRPGEKAKPANPNEWVSWLTQEHYFEDATCPWGRYGSKDTLARCNQVLEEWGFPALPKPSRGSLMKHAHRINPYAPLAQWEKTNPRGATLWK